MKKAISPVVSFFAPVEGTPDLWLFLSMAGETTV
jgi:hypothetical protein